MSTNNDALACLPVPHADAAPLALQDSAALVAIGDSDADAQRVRKRLAETLKTSLPDLVQVATHPSLVGGKLLRAQLLLCCARTVSPALPPESVDLAVALELAHLATLLHDDVIDKEDVRRHSGSFRADVGNKSSVLAGDFVVTRALLLLTSLRSQRYVDIVANAVSQVLEGELLQNHECGNLSLSAERQLHIVQLKTATLFRTACELGAEPQSGANPACKQLLANIGTCLGTAYQLADDYADYFGDSARLGKLLGRDFSNGVVTLPLIHAVARSNTLRDQIASDFGRRRLSANAMRRLVDQMRDLGSERYARTQVLAFVASARDHVHRLELEGVDTRRLSAFIEWFWRSVSVGLIALSDG